MFIRIDHRTLVESKGRTEKQCKSDYYRKLKERKSLITSQQEYMNILCDRKNEIKDMLKNHHSDKELLENELMEIAEQLQADNKEIIAL